MSALALPFLAGILTTLSPCVLPVLPFVTASSLGKNKMGPIALAFGLLVTFVGTSTLLALSGRVLGLEPSVLKKIAAAGLMLSGLLFLIPSWSERFTSFFSSFVGKASQASQKQYGGPLVTEFLSGLFLGIVWAPCSGPSLGTAISLAAQSETAARAALLLTVFGLGAIIPLLGIAYGTRGLLGRIKSHIAALNAIKKTFGALMVLFGLLILTGTDKLVEAALLGAMPESWMDLITKF